MQMVHFRKNWHVGVLNDTFRIRRGLENFSLNSRSTIYKEDDGTIRLDVECLDGSLTCLKIPWNPIGLAELAG